MLIPPPLLFNEHGLFLWRGILRERIKDAQTTALFFSVLSDYASKRAEIR
jgi:hypothetical protein